jgi:hypothetical protein
MLNYQRVRLAFKARSPYLAVPGEVEAPAQFNQKLRKLDCKCHGDICLWMVDELLRPADFMARLHIIQTTYVYVYVYRIYICNYISWLYVLCIYIHIYIYTYLYMILLLFKYIYIWYYICLCFLLLCYCVFKKHHHNMFLSPRCLLVVAPHLDQLRFVAQLSKAQASLKDCKKVYPIDHPRYQKWGLWFGLPD